jgi:hypothetical protein
MQRGLRSALPDQYDGPWKNFVDEHLSQFIEFFVPDAYEEIDWAKKPVSLNTELRRLRRGNRAGDRRVDSLFEIYLKTGETHRVLIHIEVQSTRDRDLPMRMFEYSYRAWDRHRQRVASIAILADTGPKFRPGKFGWKLWGTEMGFRYPVVKLLDFKKHWKQLEQSRNVFAVATMAQIKAKATHGDPEARLAWKRKLMRMLYERQHSREEIVSLFHLIDWMLQLPEKQEIIFEADLESVEAEHNMPYVSSFEKRALARGEAIGEARGEERGLEKGLRLALSSLLERRFGPLPGWAAEQVGKASAALLSAWTPRVLDAPRLEDVFR